MANRINFAREGEESACDYLKSRGYRILARNFRCRAGEIDIVAEHGGRICFVEVKSRNNLISGTPKEAVTVLKMRRIVKSALFYLKANGLSGRKARFDVVSFIPGGQGR